MDWETLKPYASAAVRWGLGLAAGGLVKAGLISSSQNAEFVQMGSGIVLGGIVLAWSWWQKTHQAKAIAVASSGGIVKT